MFAGWTDSFAPHSQQNLAVLSETVWPQPEHFIFTHFRVLCRSLEWNGKSKSCHVAGCFHFPFCQLRQFRSLPPPPGPDSPLSSTCTLNALNRRTDLWSVRRCCATAYRPATAREENNSRRSHFALEYTQFFVTIVLHHLGVFRNQKNALDLSKPNETGCILIIPWRSH